MMTYQRAGSSMVVHVNGDWSGTALVAQIGSPFTSTIPVADLLRGWIRGPAAESAISLVCWLEAVSIAVEAYTTHMMISALGKAPSVLDLVKRHEERTR